MSRVDHLATDILDRSREFLLMWTEADDDTLAAEIEWEHGCDRWTAEEVVTRYRMGL